MSLDDTNLYIWLDDNRFRSSFWNHLENQQSYSSWLSKRLNISDFEQWYTISPEVIKINKGTTLLTKYNNDMYLFLKSVYPSHQWFQEKFNTQTTTIKIIEAIPEQPQVEQPQIEQPQVVMPQIQPQVDCKVQ